MLNRLLAALRGRKYGLRSKTIKELPFNVTVNGTTRVLYHSSFNMDWFRELGIMPKTIVDLGSFDGGDAYRFKDAFPEARVITVEADPTRFGIAQDNLAEAEVEILNCAACATDGDIDWYVATIDGAPHAQGSMYQHTEAYQKKFAAVEQSKEPTKVAGKRFETIAGELSLSGIDLLHMDIEGAEHNVLKTLGTLRPKLIFLEWREGAFQGESCGPQTEALLRSMNYALILQKKVDRLYYLPDA